MSFNQKLLKKTRINVFIIWQFISFASVVPLPHLIEAGKE